MKLDVINGLFEFCGSFMLARNVLLTFRAKTVKGVSLIATSYFMSWGIFNIFYYPSLGQHWSFLGGLCVATVNSVWVGQIIYYNHKEFYFGPLCDKIVSCYKKLRRHFCLFSISPEILSTVRSTSECTKKIKESISVPEELSKMP